MRLVRIDVLNFKSFGGEVSIPFQSGFTAITGPNGSGKSNSGDAIQFVLGTRSTKALRAENLKQLIFNGGNSGRAAKRMSATLTFTNPKSSDGSRQLRVDSDEVAFTRSVRLTERGDPKSEFRINNEKTSSGEFRRILKEAGLRGDGYNVVLQNDVTTLATMTAHRRRAILEDVAGVTAYDEDIRKASAQRKQVEGSMETIDLFEADQRKQLESLGKEREQALRFKHLKDELELNRAALSKCRYLAKIHESDALRSEQEGYRTRSHALLEEARQREKDLLSLEEELAEVGRQIEELSTGENREIIDKMRALEVEIERSKDRISDLETSVEEAQIDLEIDIDEINRVQTSIDEHEASKAEASDDIRDADIEIEQYEASIKEAKSTLETGSKLQMDLSRALGKASDAVTAAQDSHSNATLTSDRANQSTAIAMEAVASLEEEYEQATLLRDDLEIHGEDMQIEADRDDPAKLGEELMRLRKIESQLREDRDRADSRYREAEMRLEKARARLDAQTHGSAAVAAALTRLRQEGSVKGILGSIAELASPKDDNHAEGIAHALGGGMRSIVVEDDQVAADCISWLKKNGGGRATFLPLNRLGRQRPQGRSLMVARNPGVIGFVHELLNYPSEIENAIHLVSRSTLLVENLDVARRNMGGVRLVTLDGSIVEGSGAMTGGSSSRNSPSFGPSDPSLSLRPLEGAVNEASLVRATVEAALRETRDSVQQLTDKIAEFSGSESESRAREWKADLDRAEADVKNISKRLESARSELERCEAARRVASSDLIAAKEQLEEAVDARKAASEDLLKQSPDHLSRTLSEAETEKGKALVKRQQAIAKVESADVSLVVLKGRITELEKKKNRLIERCESQRKEIEGINSSAANAGIELSELRSRAKHASEELGILSSRRDSIIEERSQARTEAQNKRSERERIQVTIDALNHGIMSAESAARDLKQELLDQEIEIPGPDEEMPTLAEVERLISKIERKLDGLGDVNMLAIEQYDETANRIEQLIEDGSTLRKRRDMLVDIVDRLEDERKSRLLAVFEHISENFSRVYAILQPGGNGRLRLENPENPFDGGLEMDCVPPGKSQKTRRSQLSGGEKSMAALALVFSIQDFEPSTFYYFDEVDQNLDPFNCQRIAMLCRRRSEAAQFIMVTLRKVSLSMANHHVGITHAGDGVSRRITDFNREAALALGEAFEKEMEAQGPPSTSDMLPENLPHPSKRPIVPEPIDALSSIGGVMERAGVDPESIERGEKDPLGELRDRAEAADDGSERNPAASIDATVREEDMGQMSETE
jgi:chromosome segregation protein|tara:strand:- start:996 stop:4877 length:3882 start_codon:yes stop_codon:yes gene_type:complete